MNFLQEIQITNDLQIVKLFNLNYIDKIGDPTHPTSVNLTNNNDRLDNAVLNTYELRQENRTLVARNRDIEWLLSKLQTYALDMEKKCKDLDTYIDDMESQLETIKSHINF